MTREPVALALLNLIQHLDGFDLNYCLQESNETNNLIAAAWDVLRLGGHVDGYTRNPEPVQQGVTFETEVLADPFARNVVVHIPYQARLDLRKWIGDRVQVTVVPSSPSDAPLPSSPQGQNARSEEPL